ncbi:hypothetical protein GOV12_04885 [Candidatus Pacearchaeota archaeon]|nr:hypothetical protein [Candidatus Pacearchaeota archaeon]
MVGVTTVKISTATRERLGKLKEYERETFDEVLNKVLYVLNVCRKDSEKAKKFLESIDRKIKKREIMNKTLKDEGSKGKKE